MPAPEGSIIGLPLRLPKRPKSAKAFDYDLSKMSAKKVVNAHPSYPRWKIERDRQKASDLHHYHTTGDLPPPPKNPSLPFDYANFHRPKRRFNVGLLFVKILMIGYVFGSIALALFALPPVLVSLEWKPEVLRIQSYARVAFQVLVEC